MNGWKRWRKALFCPEKQMVTYWLLSKHLKYDQRFTFVQPMFYNFGQETKNLAVSEKVYILPKSLI